jgi:hypothetical protein
MKLIGEREGHLNRVGILEHPEYFQELRFILFPRAVLSGPPQEPEDLMYGPAPKSNRQSQVTAMRRFFQTLGIALTASTTIAVAGCGEGDPAAPVVGGDRDEHGCIGSAGYRWCEATQQCERPWELAEAQGFENTPEAFESFCSQPPDGSTAPED